MDFTVLNLLLAIFALRLCFLRISKRNEKAILLGGGAEYDAKNTRFLTIIHVIFYFSCFAEAILKGVKFDFISSVGTFLVIFAFAMLYFIVNHLLKGIWTVKLMIAKNHKYNPYWLFRYIKHPNYYLNIFPELIGLALLSHAYGRLWY
ncbi:isoprenylcysteine carboxyl methyltransferase family protein [Campylobacter iguaniorum]|uniref:Isoprenylcysteine carboxyl methyltransferase family protein n=1 Tax=Campylobacter iguaniorum TaxID=1244531 RepID=A0A076FH94_9BACT|nr:isoprenylcysteine carboxylmethyltransferase family protein [Campylobacter iguaniorum]AII15194.1 isoprenylcysteine carboxyl methyltransferase family protein [Campylobacter iguaniorum]ALV25119.1 isoprenylcysteine carboxyl methyltransferase family protein [Campylobacter iguaniorum]